MKLRKTQYKKLSDEKLMQLISNANMKAFNELYGRYKQRLLYYFYRMLGSSQEKAQDFLQDIFMKIIDNPESFDTKRKFSTWIFSVAHNMCKNEYRRLEVRKAVTLDEQTDSFADIFNDNQLDLNNFTNQLYNELNKLDEAHRTAFLLKYREGFKIKEISKALNCSEGTVKSRLFYTVKKLSQKMECYRNTCT